METVGNRAVHSEIRPAVRGDTCVQPRVRAAENKFQGGTKTGHMRPRQRETAHGKAYPRILHGVVYGRQAAGSGCAVFMRRASVPHRQRRVHRRFHLAGYHHRRQDVSHNRRRRQGRPDAFRRGRLRGALCGGTRRETGQWPFRRGRSGKRESGLGS